ncbi:MAG: hypothetical protein OXL37_16360, partial [Chloroflexota bacterium]|nr:hypothetical protein [Chloroflexota bacterium]
AFAAAYLFFYRGTYAGPPSAQVEYRSPGVASANDGTQWTPSVGERAGGLVLLDTLHSNGFSSREILTLRTRIVAQGYDLELLGNFARASESDRRAELAEKLRQADSLVVITPLVAYSAGEVDLIEAFVRKGGKLVMVSDPGRRDQMNTLAQRFGVQFRPDYLYNQVENDQNFQNIFVRDFRPDELTAGLDTVVLFTAGSITSSGPGLAVADAGTESAVAENNGDLYVMARAADRNVLAISDFTFMIPPYDSTLDNDRLLSNIIDFATTSDRVFDLADFPHFYQTGPDDGVQVLLGRPDLLGSGAKLKDGLEDYGISADIRGTEDVSRDTVFLGLHDDALQVRQYLQAAGVRVDDAVSMPFGLELDPDGTAVTVLDREGGRHVLILLGDTPAALDRAVTRLLSGGFRSDLVSEVTGVSVSAGASK